MSVNLFLTVREISVLGTHCARMKTREGKYESKIHIINFVGSQEKGASRSIFGKKAKTAGISDLLERKTC